MPNKVMLYNTLSKKIEEFIPNQPGKVKLYTCGPTVYHFAHIGNLRTYMMEDVLEKFLRYAGFDVTRAMNITDVGHLANDSDVGEDKMVAGAKREHKTVMEIAAFYTDAFFADCQKLNIKKPEIIERATSCIDEYIKLITILLEKEYAYRAGGNVYFGIDKLEDYYILTGHTSDNLAVGVRDDVEEDENKHNKGDFVLWFTESKFAEQALRWPSPWGDGYPGWHIECSAISMKHLGEYLDIHCGGIDNIFPHHTNEIAQSEAILGHKWCNYWFHVHHLNTNSGKMSKSSGKFLILQSLIDNGYNPMVYRMFCLQSHYRKPLAFSYETLDNVVIVYNKLKDRISMLSNDGELDDNSVNTYKDKFIEALSNDLNTSSGITVLYDMLKSDINDKTKRYIVEDFDKVLSLDLLSEKEIKSIDVDLEKYVLGKIEERKNAKTNKNYALSDQIRNELLKQGIILTDTKDGTTWSKN